jgi:hypothetical protein
VAGFPDVDSTLRLAVVDLRRRCGDRKVESADVAAVLHVSVDDIRQLAAYRLSRGSDISSVIAVVACLDVAVAEALREAAPRLDGRAAVEHWLQEQPLPVGTDTVLSLSDTGDLLASVRALDVALLQANQGLRALGFEPLHNAVGHQQQFSAYVQQQRAYLHDVLRDRFIEVARSGASLDEYLRLRELPGLEPNDAWLDHYWDLPDDVLAAHIGGWIDEVTPAREDNVELLPPVDELREQGRRTATRVVANARVLADAWLHRHAAGVGPRPDEASTVVAALMSSGRMDFGRITPADVVSWLSDAGQWPAKMLRTTSRIELGLTPADLEAARARLEATRDQQRRQRTYVRYGERTFTEEVSDLRELVDAVRGSLTATDLTTPLDRVPLGRIELLPGTPASGGRGGGSTWRAEPQDEKTKAIGLIGEVVIGERLRREFGLPPEDTWVSGYREDIFADGRGDDRLGFDFRVPRPDRTWLFEVKSTTGNDCQIKLGESEVRRAQALESGEEYVILFVTNVLDPAKRRIYPLPNPLGSSGLSRYRVAGSALRLIFELPLRD